MAGRVQQYVVPTKKINNQKDLEKFLKSSTFQDIWNFVLALNDAVRDKKATSNVPQSQVVHSLVEQLNRLSEWIDDIPPIEQPMRFGNAAFRTWHKRLVENSRNLLEQVLPPQLHPCIKELAPYLEDSFGNSQRIDYGSGHEATFLAFMLCLKKIGACMESDAAALVFQVFGTYLKVTRKLQTVYKLEPAGSHGVWGLDDYAFLPFLWGSSQLYSHPEITPRSVLNDQVVEMYKDEYLYIGAYLYDISCITGGWPKANQGLLKMYQAEVWNKFPVIQHFLFGSLLLSFLLG